ncbi:hypothetical protein Leryth_017040 [Lithospermum erythrorhizon]|nr:hypothetical protein Leryth_017040 [Lithospermum erythrorhizon]
MVRCDDDEHQQVQHINSTKQLSDNPSSSTKIIKNNNNNNKLPLSKDKMGPIKPKSKENKVSSQKPTKSKGSKRKRTSLNDVYDDIEAKFSVMERAERVLSSLSEEVPTFIKCMLPSNVCYSFWMILPIKFCKLYLPSHDTTITLINEWGNEYETTYLMDRHGLSAGWRGFSMSHRLLKGDILVFQLIEPCKFKVHVVRVNGVDVVDAALCLMNIDACRGTTESDIVKDNKKRKRTRTYADCFQLDVSKAHQNVQKADTKRTTSDSLQVTEKSENNINDSGCEELEGLRSSSSNSKGWHDCRIRN